MNIYQTPILLTGFNHEHNPERDYKTAKDSHLYQHRLHQTGLQVADNGRE